ncbi:MAG TPA: HlyD family efflux transporter periplasmic adaptor subunit [Gemmatimonadaceae bacterium]|jgi:multidrug efflux pump subunit AcrA (membrane-fusion protein)|nr:HlyD family efflux transporter periplasmic adaptor subunit [Gemmatimonadaceae bacterium]
MTAPRPVTPLSPRFPQRLPDASGPTPSGASFIRRAVIATFAVVGLVAAVLVTIAVSVPFDAMIDATGALEPRSLIVLRAPQAGAVQAMLVRAGDSVRAGQVVAYLDTLALVAQRAQLRTTLAVARADLGRTVAGLPIDSAIQREGILASEASLAQTRSVLRERLAEYGRGAADIDSLIRTWRVGSHVALDDAVSQVRGAAAALEQRRATLRQLSLQRFDQSRGQDVLEGAATELRLLDERIRRAAIRSPTSGIVLTEQPERSIGAMLGEGESLLEVADLSRWQLDVYVREQDAYRIATGDRVRAELPALQSSADVVLLQSRVASVALAPELGQASKPTSMETLNRGYRVVVPLDSAALAHVRRDRLKRGYTARVKILTDRGTMLQLLWRSIRHHASTP